MLEGTSKEMVMEKEGSGLRLGPLQTLGMGSFRRSLAGTSQDDVGDTVQVAVARCGKVKQDRLDAGRAELG